MAKTFETCFAIGGNPDQSVMVPRIIPLNRADRGSKLLLAGKPSTRLEENESVAVCAVLSRPHWVVPVVTEKILVHRNEEALSSDSLINDPRILSTLSGKAEILRCVDVILRAEDMPKIAVALVQEDPFRAMGLLLVCRLNTPPGHHFKRRAAAQV